MAALYKLKYSDFIARDNLIVGFKEAINPDSKFLALGIRKRYVVSNLRYACFAARRAALFLFGALVRKTRVLVSLGNQFRGDDGIIRYFRLLLISYVRNWVPGLLTNYKAISKTVFRSESALEEIGYLFSFPDVLVTLGEVDQIASVSSETRILRMPLVSTIDSSLNVTRFTYSFFSNWSSYRGARMFVDLFLSLFIEAKRFRVVRHFAVFKRFIRSAYLTRTLRRKLCFVKFAYLFLLFSDTGSKTGVSAEIDQLQVSRRLFGVSGITPDSTVSTFRFFVTKKLAGREERQSSEIDEEGLPMRFRVAQINEYIQFRLEQQNTTRRLSPEVESALSAPSRLLFSRLFPLMGYFAYGHLFRKVSSFLFYRKILSVLYEKRRRIIQLKRLVGSVSVMSRAALRLRLVRRILTRTYPVRAKIRRHYATIERDRKEFEAFKELVFKDCPHWQYKRDSIAFLKRYYEIPDEDDWKYFFNIEERDTLRVKLNKNPPDLRGTPFNRLRRLERRLPRLNFVPTSSQREVFGLYYRLKRRFPKFVRRVEGSLGVSHWLTPSFGGPKSLEIREPRLAAAESGEDDKPLPVSIAYAPPVPKAGYSFKYQRYLKNRKQWQDNKENRFVSHDKKRYRKGSSQGDRPDRSKERRKNAARSPKGGKPEFKGQRPHLEKR